MRIETERMYLYPLSDEAVRSLMESENDADMKQAYSEMLEGCLKDPGGRLWHTVWLMELKDPAGTVAGDFCFKGLGEDGAAEIGYGLRNGFCGKGYMTETLNAVSGWALSQPGIKRIEAETAPDNTASQKVLAACGFHPTGTDGQEGPRFALERKPLTEIRYASEEDWPFWQRLDRFIAEDMFLRKVRDREAYVILEAGLPAGLLRYNLFWDHIPFCIMLFVDWPKQRKGYGRALMRHWEAEMKKQGHGMIMTSTQVDESAQHFYRKLGYKDCGGFVPDVPGYEQAMEMIMIKQI